MVGGNRKLRTWVNGFAAAAGEEEAAARPAPRASLPDDARHLADALGAAVGRLLRRRAEELADVLAVAEALPLCVFLFR